MNAFSKEKMAKNGYESSDSDDIVELTEENTGAKQEQNIDENKLLEIIETLSLDEKKEALSITNDTFLFHFKNINECVGCLMQMDSILQNCIQNETKRKNFIIHSNKKIGLNESNINDNNYLAKFLSSSSKKEEKLRAFNIIDKAKVNPSSKKKKYRCFFHSKKSIPNKFWKNILDSLLENKKKISNDNIDLDFEVDLEESFFLINLQAYLKRRKFCSSCKDNIYNSYEMLKENSDSLEDFLDIQNLHKHEVLNHITKKIVIKKTDDHPLHIHNKNLNASHSHSHSHISEDLEKENVIGFNNNSMECQASISEEEYENSDDEEFEASDDLDLFVKIKYSPNKKRFYIPFHIIGEIIDMSEVDINFQLKHADTKESAQEEILICFGISIKEKLQNEWKEQKSHENLYYLFETICFDCMINNLVVLHQSQLERMGRKNALEQFLKDEENALELKKEKLKKKRSKRKEKKKNKKGKNNEAENMECSSISNNKTDKMEASEFKLNDEIVCNDLSETHCFCDENSFDNIEISETEINKFREKWKEINDLRENLRKRLENNFQNLLKKAKEN